MFTPKQNRNHRTTSLIFSKLIVEFNTRVFCRRCKMVTASYVVKSFKHYFSLAPLEKKVFMKSYRELLERAKSKLPQERSTGERFEIPRVRSRTIARTRTIVHNFKEIADALNRNPQHLMKFLTNEMATAGSLDKTRASFQGRFSSQTLERLLLAYTESFLKCPVCKRPDTRIVKEKRLFFLVCEACGARSSVKAV